jgi:hypothetical protein
MLENKVIVYDDSCPMCRAYTSGFVRMGILQAQNRVGFAHAAPGITCHLDLTRARHEIPLVDLQTGEVTYGIDALFLVITHRYPVFTRLFKSARFRASVYSLYQLVTYNRRVIAGCAPPCDGFDCAPDFHPGARLRYLRLALTLWLLITLGVLWRDTAGHRYLLATLLACAIGAQSIRLVLALRSRHPWDQLAGVATNGLLCALLLSPSVFALPVAGAWGNFVGALLIGGADAVRRRRNMI